MFPCRGLVAPCQRAARSIGWRDLDVNAAARRRAVATDTRQVAFLLGDLWAPVHLAELLDEPAREYADGRR